MDRLTTYLSDGTATIARKINGLTVQSNYLLSSDIEAVKRLAAYEDTGLEPEEMNAVKLFAAAADPGKARRIIELLEADKQGLVIILPCKERTTVYRIHRVYGKRGVSDEPFLISGLHDIGKTVFLTREEAEAALGGDEDG